jgi:hypothetical protein
MIVWLVIVAIHLHVLPFAYDSTSLELASNKIMTISCCLQHTNKPSSLCTTTLVIGNYLILFMYNQSIRSMKIAIAIENLMLLEYNTSCCISKLLHWWFTIHKCHSCKLCRSSKEALNSIVSSNYSNTTIDHSCTEQACLLLGWSAQRRLRVR